MPGVWIDWVCSVIEPEGWIWKKSCGAQRGVNAADASFQPRSSCADRRLVEEELGQWFFFFFFLITGCCFVTLWPPKLERLSEVSGQCCQISDTYCPLNPFPAAVIPPAFEALKSTSNANWFAVLERTADLYLSDLLIVEAKSRNAIFWPLLPWSWYIAAFSSCLASSWTGLSGLLQRKVSVMMLRLFCVCSSSSLKLVQ